MPKKCQHPAVVIAVEYVEHADMHSFDLSAAAPAMTRICPPLLGSITALSGYWSRAHLHIRCKECGHDAWFTSADHRQFPKWLRKHWDNLVAAGGLPRQISEHYRMFEEAPCPQP